MTPPNSCEIPVIQSGEVVFALIPLIIIETTVHIDAAIISISPAEKPSNDLLVFMAIIPQKPINAPSIFAAENFSSFVNKNEKQVNKRGASCFNIAVFEPEVLDNPT